MSGDWIKMRISLSHDPKVLAIAHSIGSQPHFAEWLTCGQICECPVSDSALRLIVTGALHAVWSAANEHSSSGKIFGANLRWIDVVSGVTGFGEAMKNVGWAEEKDGYLFFPKFDSNNTSAAERQRRYRNKARNKRYAESDVTRDVTRDVTGDVTRGATLRPREEKRREDKRRENKEEYSSDFERFWQAFPPGRRQAKRKAWEAWKRAIRRADAETIIAAAAEYAESETGQGQYVKGPEPWLNGDHWDDDRHSWNPSSAIVAGKVGTKADALNWDARGGVQ